MPISRILIFFTVVLSVTFGLHYYFWARLVRDPAMVQPWRTIVLVLLILAGLSLPATFTISRLLGEPARFLAWPAFVWMGLMFFLFVSLLASDAIRLVSFLSERWRDAGELADPLRRQFLFRVLGAGAATVASSLGAFATYIAARGPKVRSVEVKLARLPKSMDGLRIVQLTDVHIGPTLRREFLESVVKQTNDLQPDVIAITGDLVDGTLEELREHVAPLKQLKAKHGVFFVTGNHEYYSGVQEWMAELTQMGIRVLRNERVSIGEGDQSFDLAGIDDHSAHRLVDGHGADLPKALLGRDPARELILLAHQPKAIFEAAKLGVGLQLSGHTHGGQIWPFTYLVKLQQPFVAGLAKVENTILYVSSGTGYWGPPMRLGTTAEVTNITLRAATA